MDNTGITMSSHKARCRTEWLQKICINSYNGSRHMQALLCKACFPAIRYLRMFTACSFKRQLLLVFFPLQVLAYAFVGFLYAIHMVSPEQRL